MNALEYATVKSIVANNDSVTLTIDLSTHAHLNDQEVVRTAMNDYVNRYRPKITHWVAEAIDANGENLLIITVSGQVDMEAVSRYM